MLNCPAMKPHVTAILTAAAVLCAALTLAPAPGLGQETGLSARGKAIKAKRLAESFKRNAGQLTIFDRQGKVVTTVGERDLFNEPFFSPDGKRIAVVKQNPEKETADLWVYDVATGKATQITFGQSTERTQSPVWSPDGSQLAFVGLRAGSFGIYRKASDGQGSEELLHKLPGIGANLRLVNRWPIPDLRRERPFRRRGFRLAAGSHGRRAKAGRSLSQRF